MSKYDKNLAAILSIIIVIGVSLGVRGCWSYTRETNLACMRAGGTLINIEGHRGCYRLTNIQLDSLQVNKK